jgi:ADP-ribose pyrophosphatase YjhB (NUDIX family)
MSKAASPNSHCAYCGAEHTEVSWPRTCAACGNISYLNPLPVALCLVPVDDGLLLIRRSIEPVGLALPGGFIDAGEDWRVAAARELFEEARVVTDPEGITLRSVLSAPDGTVLIFGQAEGISSGELPPFTPSGETSERLVVYEPPDGIVFDRQDQVVREFFSLSPGLR